MAGTIEIFTGDVSDVEAQVFARYVAEDLAGDALGSERIELKGTLRGPYCKSARTLAAEVKFRDLSSTRPGVAQAIVPDPCLWSHELPHLYDIDVEASCAGRVVAEYHGMIGLQRARNE